MCDLAIGEGKIGELKNTKTEYYLRQRKERRYKVVERVPGSEQ